MVQDPEIVSTCRHCGNCTVLRVLYESERRKDDVTLLLVDCRSCEEASLLERVWTRDLFDPFGSLSVTEETVLYPSTGATQFRFLPREVRKEYESALNIMRHDANAFGVMVRRTLEAVCKERGVQRGTLACNLREMASRNEMPGTLADIADHLRLVSNIGAHHSGADISKDDLPALLDFLNLVLEYLYEAPGRLRALQAKASHAEREADGTLE